jgi:hypothetical protein
MDDIKLAAHDETAFARTPRYYGVHHLALNTDDMKMTVDFYVGGRAPSLRRGTRRWARQKSSAPSIRRFEDDAP